MENIFLKKKIISEVLPSAIAIFSLTPFLFATSVMAAEKDLYIGGLLGQARGQVGATEMNQRMATLGYDAEANVSNQNRLAWKLFAGYQYSQYVGIEAGYIDLGEVRTHLKGSAADITNYLNSANLVHPRSGSGYEFALLGTYPLSEKSYLFARAGLLFSNSKYQASTDVALAKRTTDGNDGFLGLGYGYDINPNWGLRLNVENYRVEDERIALVGLSLLYRFHEKTPKKIIEPTHIKIPPVVPPVVAARPVEPPKDPCAQPNPPKDLCAPKLIEPKSIKLAVQFATNSDVVTENYFSDIIKLAEFMKLYTNTKVTIEGHTDDRGDNQMNKDLSQRRARSVRNILIQKLGIESDRVDFIGYGEERPIADNKTEQGRAENRRVMAEISITKSTMPTKNYK